MTASKESFPERRAGIRRSFNIEKGIAFAPREAGLSTALESPTGPGPVLCRYVMCHGAGLLCLAALTIVVREGKQVCVIVQPCGETRV